MKKKYGPWTFDSDKLTLTHRAYGGYEIDITDMNTCASVLDWIFQIQSKDWTDNPETVASLIQAIEEIINPQATLCSCSKDGGKINVRNVVEKNASVRGRQ